MSRKKYKQTLSSAANYLKKMGYRSVVEPLPDTLEDSIPCNKEGKKRGRDRGRDGEKEEGKEGDRRQCVCGGGGILK